MSQLTARTLNFVAMLNPCQVAALAVAEGTPRLQLNITVPAFGVVRAELAAKGVRRPQATISAHGADGVAVLLQSKLGKGNAQVRVAMPAI